jgi:hypothetical protein
MNPMPPSLAPANDAGAITLPASVSRRSLIRLALAGAGIAATGPVLARTGLLPGGDGTVRQDVIPGVISGTAPFAGPVFTRFERDVIIPATLVPTSSTAATSTARATRTYDLEHRVTTQQILPAPFPATEIWSYNGTVPARPFASSATVRSPSCVTRTACRSGTRTRCTCTAVPLSPSSTATLMT